MKFRWCGLKAQGYLHCWPDRRGDLAQRNSEYARIADDYYETPHWVYQELLDREDFAGYWDPAPPQRDFDFLEHRTPYRVIASNPPFRLADEFVAHALALTEPLRGRVAMLLPHAWDTARKRQPLLGSPFKCKYTLLRRIRWTNLEQKKNGPSTNHGWFVWDWAYEGAPTLKYIP